LFFAVRFVLRRLLDAKAMLLGCPVPCTSTSHAQIRFASVAMESHVVPGDGIKAPLAISLSDPTTQDTHSLNLHCVSFLANPFESHISNQVASWNVSLVFH
jgi:hypothetical protein